MKGIDRFIKDNRGFVTIRTLIIMVLIILFVVIPLCGVVMDHVIIEYKRYEFISILKTTTKSSYAALDIANVSTEDIELDISQYTNIFTSTIKENFKLEDDLTPKEGSLVDSKFIIDELKYYGTSSLPYTDTENNITYVNPLVHVTITIPLKPKFLTREIIKLLGKDHIEIKLTYNWTLPKNN